MAVTGSIPYFAAISSVPISLSIGRPTDLISKLSRGGHCLASNRLELAVWQFAFRIMIKRQLNAVPSFQEVESLVCLQGSTKK